MSPLPAILHSLPRHSPRLRRQEAFTLVELLVGTALSVIVVSSLAAIALISELKLGRESEVNQALRDNWGRALSFIRNEAQHADWIRTSVADYPCEGGAPASPLLVLQGPPDPTDPTSPLWQVVYGVRENSAGSRDWRGPNLLVRCGPPFEAIDRGTIDRATDPTALGKAANAANLTFTGPYKETVIVDQLRRQDPFQVVIYDQKAGRDRDAQVRLFLSRNSGASYPPANTFSTDYQMQIRANRTPGYGTADPQCTTSTNATTGNQEPPETTKCEPIEAIKDSRGRFTTVKNFHLPTSGNLQVNGVSPSGQGALSTSTIEVIYLNGTYDSFTTKQFAANDSNRPCSRASCYISNGSQSVQIYDGNVLVFTDRVIRL